MKEWVSEGVCTYVCLHVSVLVCLKEREMDFGQTCEDIKMMIVGLIMTSRRTWLKHNVNKSKQICPGWLSNLFSAKKPIIMLPILTKWRRISSLQSKVIQTICRTRRITDHWSKMHIYLRINIYNWAEREKPCLEAYLKLATINLQRI